MYNYILKSFTILIFLLSLSVLSSCSNPTPSSSATATFNKPLSGVVIGIDAGHQLHGNSDLEQNAPHSSIYKEKVAPGVVGVSHKVNEELINLQVALKLQSALEELGADVIMTRTTEDTNISNKERAELFNNASVDFGIRIHCDFCDTESVHGLSLLIPDSKNNASIYLQSERLAESLIGSLCNSTGAANRGVAQRDDQTGFNWSNVPIVIVEMGFLSNETEEENLIDQSYQDKLVNGYVQGILTYIKN